MVPAAWAPAPMGALEKGRRDANGDGRSVQLRMKPSHSPSAQARVFSIASP
jgi:hypothetical protein